MMPFRQNPKGHPQSREDDRKNITKQMKVRTIIKDDDSWIRKPDDTEGQTIELPPVTSTSEEHCSAEPPLIKPQKDRPPAPRPSSGYIIRGVFTKPVDSTSLLQTHYPATFEAPKRVEVVEDKASPERTQTLPSLSRQLFGFTSEKTEETHMGHDPKLESTLVDLSLETSEKRAFLEYKERNISSTSEDIPREEEEKYLYPDVERSSTWSTDSNHGSNGSQNDLDEIEITSKKASAFSYSNEYISSTQGGGHEDPSNLQSVEVNVPSLSDPYTQESNTQQTLQVLPLPREPQTTCWNLPR
ncbi:uncharacterized protein [Petaurus breviceps papuanus]|uniref:uncharacterized protein n=1 Tax=Petaurus breviceps papuanus TaxID=3040969 RepID=UPI0036DACE24